MVVKINENYLKLKSSYLFVEVARREQEFIKNNPEKLSQETMELYKTENMSPFSGCFSAIAQIILLFAVFYMVLSMVFSVKFN
mgnify:CR=1 FL=1